MAACRACSQGERVRRVGVLMTTSLSDPETQTRAKAFLQGMQELGWTEGRNVRFDIVGTPAQLMAPEKLLPS